MKLQRLPIFVLTLAVLASTVFTTGCRKGENDPFISFRSRKARLTGDWTVETSTVTVNDTTYVFDGTNLTTTVGGSETVAPHAAGYTWKFENNGKYESVETNTFPDGYFGQGSLGYTETITTNGTWNFTGGDDDYKKGERLLLLPDKVQITRSNTGSNISATNIEGQTNGMVYDLDQLRNKELDWKYSETISTVTGNQIRTGEVSLKKD